MVDSVAGDPPKTALAVRVEPKGYVAVALLTILAAVPLAVIALGDHRFERLYEDVALNYLTGGSAGPFSPLAVAIPAACLAAPLAAWLARALDPLVVLLGGLAVLGAGYWLAQAARSTADVTTVRALIGAGAGALLASTAALVGATSPRYRPYLAGMWAAALVGGVAARVGLGTHDPLTLVPAFLPQVSPDGRIDPGEHVWQFLVRPYPWLLAAAGVLVLVLAVASTARRYPRQPAGRADWAALLPLVPGAAVAALVLAASRGHGPFALGPRPGWTAILLLAVLVVTVTAVLVAIARGPSGMRLGAVAPAQALTCSGAVLGAAVALVERRQGSAPGLAFLAEETLRGSNGMVTALAVAAGVAAAVGGLVGALVLAPRRPAAMVAGLLAALAGVLALLPFDQATPAALLGWALLAGGTSLVLAVSLAAARPLAAAVAGGLAVVGLAAADALAGSLVDWRVIPWVLRDAPTARDLTGERAAGALAYRTWLGMLAGVLLLAVLTVVIHRRVTRSPAAAPAG